MIVEVSKFTGPSTALPVIQSHVYYPLSLLTYFFQEIAHTLHAKTSESFGARTSYQFTSAVIQPVIASISSLFGRQPLLLMSLIYSTVSGK